jgi:anti-anti-sigma factor
LSSEQSWLEIREVHDLGRIRVQLQGELDLASAPSVAARLRELRDRHERVLLDLDELDFIDMSGLRMVLSAAQDAGRDGWAFAVTRGSAPVRRLAGLTLLGRQLPFEGSAE